MPLKKILLKITSCNYRKGNATFSLSLGKEIMADLASKLKREEIISHVGSSEIQFGRGLCLAVDGMTWVDDDDDNDDCCIDKI